jgi:hypothetical protein
MTTVKRALCATGMFGLGILAAIGIYLACVIVAFLLGGLFYSLTLGGLIAPLVAVVIVIYRWTRRRSTTSWPMMSAMVATQVTLAVWLFLESPSLTRTWFH